LEELQWYREVLQSEEEMLRKFGSLRIWMRSTYGDGRPVVPASDAASILLRLKTLLTTAQKVCEEYAEGWLQPHHLLGGVCNEEHRQLVAAHVLLFNGMEQELQEALATAVPVGFSHLG
jgi:hypothetical protein